MAVHRALDLPRVGSPNVSGARHDCPSTRSTAMSRSGSNATTVARRAPPRPPRTARHRLTPRRRARSSRRDPRPPRSRCPPGGDRTPGPRRGTCRAVACSFTVDDTRIDVGGAGTSGAALRPANTSGALSSTSWRIASTASGGVGNSWSIALRDRRRARLTRGPVGHLARPRAATATARRTRRASPRTRPRHGRPCSPSRAAACAGRGCRRTSRAPARRVRR